VASSSQEGLLPLGRALVGYQSQSGCCGEGTLIVSSAWSKTHD